MRSEQIKKMNVVIIIIASILIIAIIVGVSFLWLKGKVSFDANDKEFFRQIALVYEEDEYQLHSLDAYYLSDTKTFFYNAKYTSYSPIDEKWYDVDEVKYGTIGKFHNFYCLSWDSLHGFEGVNEEFKQAVKEGVHKTYTQEELQKLLDTAYKEKNN